MLEFAIYKASFCDLYTSVTYLIPPLHVNMRTFILSALGVCSVVAQSSTVDSYISTESPIARSGLLANIGANGNKSASAKVGINLSSIFFCLIFFP